jgi:hypothetical protein
MSQNTQAASKADQKLRSRMAELVLIVILSPECGDGLRADVMAIAQQLGLMRVHDGQPQQG